MRIVAPVLSVLLLAGTAVTEADQPAEAVETKVDLAVADTLIMFAFTELFDVEEPEEVFPSKSIALRSFAKRLPPEIRRRMPHRDGWGAEFKIVLHDDSVLLVSSAGPNGRHDLLQALADEAKRNDDGGGNGGDSLYESIRDDIVLDVGSDIVDGSTASDGQQRRAMADLRSLGTAIESYSIDNNVYPAQDADLQPVDVIRDKLSPIYIRTPPSMDPWGGEYMMWGTEGEYCILSRGADGRFDQYYGFVHSGTDGYTFEGATQGADADILFCNGQFTQWPEGTQQ